MPARKKPLDQKQDRHPTRVKVVALDTPTAEPPVAPAGLLKVVRESWDRYWLSQVQGASDDVDLPALRRLFLYYDEWERALAAVRQARLVEGSMGQPRLNPLADYMVKLEGHINRLETQFGLSPKSRVDLGIAIGHAKLTAAELNRMTYADTEEEDGHAIEAELLEEWEEAR